MAGWRPKHGLLEFERHLKHSSQFDGSRIREEPFRACEEIACRMALGTVSFNQSPMRSRAPVVFPLGGRVAAKRVSPQFGPGGGAPRDSLDQEGVHRETLQPHCRCMSWFSVSNFHEVSDGRIRMAVMISELSEFGSKLVHFNVDVAARVAVLIIHCTVVKCDSFIFGTRSRGCTASMRRP